MQRNIEKIKEIEEIKLITSQEIQNLQNSILINNKKIVDIQSSNFYEDAKNDIFNHCEQEIKYVQYKDLIINLNTDHQDNMNMNIDINIIGQIIKCIFLIMKVPICKMKNSRDFIKSFSHEYMLQWISIFSSDFIANGVNNVIESIEKVLDIINNLKFYTKDHNCIIKQNKSLAILWRWIMLMLEMHFQNIKIKHIHDDNHIQNLLLTEKLNNYKSLMIEYERSHDSLCSRSNNVINTPLLLPTLSKSKSGSKLRNRYYYNFNHVFIMMILFIIAFIRFNLKYNIDLNLNNYI